MLSDARTAARAWAGVRFACPQPCPRMSYVSRAVESSVEPQGRRLAEDVSSEVPHPVVVRRKKRQRWPLRKLQVLARGEPEPRKPEFGKPEKVA